MANNTDWLNISQMTGGTGETTLSLTALTNNSLEPKTATITARNTQYNVSDTTTVTIQGFQPTLALSRSTLRFDSTGGTATFTVYSNTAWTISFPAIVHSYSASAGTGDTEVTVALAQNFDEVAKIDTGIVKDTFNVNQLYLTIVQESFIVELNVEPTDDIVFKNTGSTTAITIDSNAVWELEYPSWVTPSVTSGESGTTTVTFTAGQNGPTDRSSQITVYAGSKSVTINVFQSLYIPPYITVTPASWTFTYTEDGKTFVVDSYPGWTGEIVSTAETVWESDIYMEATFEIPSAMTMPLYSSVYDTVGIYNGPIRIYGDSIVFETSGTYKIRYEIALNGKTPSIHSTYLTNLYFSDGIGSIGGFSGCSSLTAITSDCVVVPSVDSSVFRDVGYGGTLVFPEGSNYNSWLSPAAYFLGYYGWAGFSGKTYMSVEYNVTSTTQPTKILDNNIAYGSYTNIFSKVTLEDGEIIYNYAEGDDFNSGYTFSETGSNKLRFYPITSTIPDGRANPKGCFYNCTAITSVELSDITTYLGSCFSGCSSLSSITLNDIVKYIGSMSISALTGISMPDSVTGFGGFNYCSSLRTIKLSDNINSFPEVGGFGPFKGCQSLTGITIPSSVRTLPSRSFEDCASLTTVNLSNITDIGSHCFTDCTSLSEVVIGNNTTSIGDACFSGCTGLKRLYIGNGLETIPLKAFYNCRSLTNVYIGNGLLSLSGGREFQGCTSLTSITIEAIIEPTFSQYSFADVGENGTLYYPEGSNYDGWLRTTSGGNNTLGQRGWTGVEISF